MGPVSVRPAHAGGVARGDFPVDLRAHGAVARIGGGRAARGGKPPGGPAHGGGSHEDPAAGRRAVLAARANGGRRRRASGDAWLARSGQDRAGPDRADHQGEKERKETNTDHAKRSGLRTRESGIEPKEPLLTAHWYCSLHTPGTLW